MTTKDFDRFMAEREDARMAVKVLGREISVPRELPWYYMLKVDRLVRSGEPISGEDNERLLRQVLSKEDYDYLTGHPSFRASWFWEIIAFGWLRDGDEARAEPVFRTEDDMKVRETAEKNGSTSAPSTSGRT